MGHDRSNILDLEPTHLAVDREAIASLQPAGRVFFLPGSRSRAVAIAGSFAECRVFPSPRGHDVHLGRLRRDSGWVDIGVVSTGMGCPSVDIIVTELIALGATTFLRVGTAGSLQPARVRAGHVVIATGAVRDEGTSRVYAPIEYPAIASFEMVAAMRAAAVARDLRDVTFAGVVHSKDSLYGREFGLGPRAEENARYMRLLSSCGAIASEMESSHLFVLASVHSTPERPIHAGCVLAVIGDDEPFGSADVKDLAVSRAQELALEAACLLVEEGRTP